MPGYGRGVAYGDLCGIRRFMWHAPFGMFWNMMLNAVKAQ